MLKSREYSLPFRFFPSIPNHEIRERRGRDEKCTCFGKKATLRRQEGHRRGTGSLQCLVLFVLRKSGLLPYKSDSSGWGRLS